MKDRSDFPFLSVTIRMAFLKKKVEKLIKSLTILKQENLESVLKTRMPPTFPSLSQN